MHWRFVIQSRVDRVQWQKWHLEILHDVTITSSIDNAVPIMRTYFVVFQLLGVLRWPTPIIMKIYPNLLKLFSKLIFGTKHQNFSKLPNYLLFLLMLLLLVLGLLLIQHLFNWPFFQRLHQFRQGPHKSTNSEHTVTFRSPNQQCQSSVPLDKEIIIKFLKLSSIFWRTFYHCGMGEIQHIKLTTQEVVNKNFLQIFREVGCLSSNKPFDFGADPITKFFYHRHDMTDFLNTIP